MSSFITACITAIAVGAVVLNQVQKPFSMGLFDGGRAALIALRSAT